MHGRGGTPHLNLLDLLDEDGVLLAVGEVLARSMNGQSSYRLSRCLDDLAFEDRGRCDPHGPAGEGASLDAEDRQWLDEGLRSVDGDRLEHWLGEVARLRSAGVKIVRCSSADYPVNLRLIHDRPPILFVRGDLPGEDRRSIAIVGTRRATQQGVDFASELASELARTGVTIVSGLAKGIDAAAHRGALRVGGRTVAVFGTTIDRVYPAAHRDLADEVAASGACVSQFLPGLNTGRWSFPARNIVTSGLSLGSVIVEAAETSGARIQAEAALRHGKTVYLIRSLVTTQDWARTMSTNRAGVRVVSTVDEVLSELDQELRPVDSLLL